METDFAKCLSESDYVTDVRVEVHCFAGRMERTTYWTDKMTGKSSFRTDTIPGKAKM